MICLTMFLIPSAVHLPQLIVLFSIMGAAEAVVWPTLGAFAVESGRYYGQGSMMGLYNMSMSAGMLLGSVIAGSLMDLWGMEYAFYSIAGLLAVGTVFSCRLIATDQREILSRR